MGASLRKLSGGNKMEDTVTLARQEREKQGPWEAEVSYGGEADLHKHLTGCDKNPGHQKFIPVDLFNLEHLPPGWQVNDLVDFVRAVSDLTVLVSVKRVSDSRPETVPRSDKSFPCYKGSGKGMMRSGTGWVNYVDIFPDKHDKRYTTCECKECVNSTTPKTQFAHIHIRTAAHVVYDDLEAAHTTCHLFFDKGSTPDVCSGVVTLSGMSVVRSHPERDRCIMKYVTHDLDLSEKLDKLLTCFTLTRNSIISHLSPQPKSSNVSADTDKLNIIVSHPHGCRKQVSVGRYTDTKKGREDGLIRYIYNTPTCPGSSGARVFTMGETRWDMMDCYVHSGGHYKGRLQENFSMHCYGLHPDYDSDFDYTSDSDSEPTSNSDSESDSDSDSDSISNFVRGPTPTPTPGQAPVSL